MKCPKCGSDVDDEANFCSKCGFKLKVNTEALKIKINEFRHKIYEGCISMALGLGLMFFGVWLGFNFVGTKYEWRGLTLFKEPAFFFFVAGSILLISGAIRWIYYDYKKDKLLKQLEKD